MGMGFGWVKRVDPYPYPGLFPSTQPGWSTRGNPYLQKVCPISMQSFLPHRLRFYLLMKGYGPRCHLNHSRLVQDTTKNTTVNNNVWNTITVTNSSFCFYFVDTSFLFTYVFFFVDNCFWLYAYPFYKLLVILIWVILWLTFPMTRTTLVTRIFQWLTLWLVFYSDFSWLILWLVLIV